MNEQKSDIVILAILSFFGGVMLTIVMGNVYNREELLRQEESEFKNQGNTFIWNDDWESIPADGSLIRIEFTENDTIYIGSAE